MKKTPKNQAEQMLAEAKEEAANIAAEIKKTMLAELQREADEIITQAKEKAGLITTKAATGTLGRIERRGKRLEAAHEAAYEAFSELLDISRTSADGALFKCFSELCETANTPEELEDAEGTVQSLADLLAQRRGEDFTITSNYKENLE